VKKPLLIAIILSVVLHQLLGYLWYAVLPFAGTRLAALGRPASEVSIVDPVALTADFVLWIVASVVLVTLASRSMTRTAGQGAMLGALLWMGVALPAIVPHYAFAHIPGSVSAIDAANSLVTLLISGAVIGIGVGRASRA
jgi:hypothetical protein